MRTTIKRAAVALPAAGVLGLGALGVLGDAPSVLAHEAPPAGVTSGPATTDPDPTSEDDSNESSEDGVKDGDTDSNFDDKDTEFNSDEAADGTCAGSAGEDKSAVPVLPDLATINVC